MTGPLAPVLGRIAEIETRFNGGPPVAALDQPADEAAGFAAAYELANAAAPSTEAPTQWQGVGSSGWVFPGAAGAAQPMPAVSGTWAVGAMPSSGIVPASTPFAGLFESAGARHGVPPRLLAAVGWVESRYQTDAVSGAGAQGVMQLMPFVSEAYGVNPWDPAQAIDAAAKILSEHYARFGSWDLALAAYNAGAGAVAAAGNQPPSPRVAGYVTAVNQRIEQM